LQFFVVNVKQEAKPSLGKPTVLMADKRLRTKLQVTWRNSYGVGSERISSPGTLYAELLLEGAKPKVAPAPVDPALERDRLAFEMKRWEAEQQKWEAEQEERKLQREEAKQRREEKMRKWKAEQEERRLLREEDIKKLASQQTR